MTTPTIVPPLPPVTPPVTPPVKPAAPPKMIANGGKLFDFFDKGGWRGYLPSTSTVPDGEPYMQWTGGKISISLWQQILAFFEWTQSEFKSEGMVRLYYHEVEHRWNAWAFPQEPNGMTVKELADNPLTAVQRAREFPLPWSLFGTVHHHCTSSAFQSGTDSNDEQGFEGLHITVGGISSPEYSLHARACLRQSQYICTDFLHQWFESPDWFMEIPPQERTMIIKAFREAKINPTIFNLKQPPAADTAFPADWKTNCIKPVHKTYNYNMGSKGFGGGDHNGHSEFDYGTGLPSNKGPSSDGSDLFAQFQIAELKFMEACQVKMDKATMTHSAMDALMYAVISGENKNPSVLVEKVLASAKSFNLTERDVDRLFDMWDFDIVLKELAHHKRWPTAADAPPSEPEAQAALALASHAWES